MGLGLMALFLFLSRLTSAVTAGSDERELLIAIAATLVFFAIVFMVSWVVHSLFSQWAPGRAQFGHRASAHPPHLDPLWDDQIDRYPR